MKAKFVCFKLSIPVCMLCLIIVLEIVFIVFQIKGLREERKL